MANRAHIIKGATGGKKDNPTATGPEGSDIKLETMIMGSMVSNTKGVIMAWASLGLLKIAPTAIYIEPCKKTAKTRKRKKYPKVAPVTKWGYPNRLAMDIPPPM